MYSEMRFIHWEDIPFALDQLSLKSWLAEFQLRELGSAVCELTKATEDTAMRAWEFCVCLEMRFIHWEDIPYALD